MSNLTDETISNHIHSFESDLWTSIPARVVSIQNGDQTKISAKPVLNRLLRGLESQELPEIKDVPVVWPGSSQSLVRGVLKVGDWVRLDFSARPLQNWLNSEGQVVDPESFQKHNYNSAIATPGLFPFSMHPGSPDNQSLPDNQNDMVMKTNIGTDQESEVRIKESGDVVITATSSGTVITIAADGSLVIDASAGVTVNGDITVNGSLEASDDIKSTGGDITADTGDVKATAGDVLAAAISLTSHTHLYAPGPGSPTPTAPPA